MIRTNRRCASDAVQCTSSEMWKRQMRADEEGGGGGEMPHRHVDAETVLPSGTIHSSVDRFWAPPLRIAARNRALAGVNIIGENAWALASMTPESPSTSAECRRGGSRHCGCGWYGRTHLSTSNVWSAKTRFSVGGPVVSLAGASRCSRCGLIDVGCRCTG